MTAAGLDDGRKRMERPNAWPTPFPDDLLIFLSSESASAKRGSSVQLRWRESDCSDGATGTALALSMASLVRWSARVATEVGAEVKGDGDDFLILPSEEEGHMLRAGAAAPGAAVSDRETERRALWRKGESAAAGMTDRPGSWSAPEDGEEDHRLDDDMADGANVRACSAECRCGWRTNGASVLYVCRHVYGLLDKIGLEPSRPARSDGWRATPAEDERVCGVCRRAGQRGMRERQMEESVPATTTRTRKRSVRPYFFLTQ